MQHYLGLVPCRYIDQERGKASFRLCALLIRIILLPSRSSILHTHLYVYLYFMWQTAFPSFFFSPASFSSFSRLMCCCCCCYCWFLVLSPFVFFFFFWFCCFLFIGVQSTLPSIQASLLTSTSFFGCFYAPRAAIFYINSYSSKLYFFLAGPNFFPCCSFTVLRVSHRFKFSIKNNATNSKIEERQAKRQGARKLVKSHLYKNVKVSRVGRVACLWGWVSAIKRRSNSNNNNSTLAFHMCVCVYNHCGTISFTWRWPLLLSFWTYEVVPPFGRCFPSCLMPCPVTFCAECIHWYSHLFPVSPSLVNKKYWSASHYIFFSTIISSFPHIFFLRLLILLIFCEKHILSGWRDFVVDAVRRRHSSVRWYHVSRVFFFSLSA